MIFQLHFITLVLAKTTPLLLACSGGLLSELSGVINFALEGMMLAGAFAGVWASYVSGSPWIGLLGGAVGGMIIGLLHASASLNLRANQIVSSIAMNLLALGVTGMLLNQVFEVYGTSPAVDRLPDIGQVISAVFPVSGDIAGSFGRLSVVVPFALIIYCAILAFLKWSKCGLRVRACGESPDAARAAGIHVFRIRFLAVTFGGALAGLGGAYLSIGELSQFVEHITHGRGYLAIAALVLGRWRPTGILLACLLFGMTEALSEWLSVRRPQLPYQAFLAFPYIVCFLILMRQAAGIQPPSALGRLS